MNILKEWIINIVSICLIGVLFDIVMPNGNLKKYGRFIIGLVTLVVIISPILDLLDQLPQLEKYIASNVFDLNSKSFEYQSKIVSETQQSQVKKIFQANIENHIEQEIQRETGYNNVRARVELGNTDIQEMSGLDRIYIEIRKGEEGIKPVEPVYINVNYSENSNQKKENATDIDSVETARIKKYVSEIYKIDPSKIYISWIDD